MENNEDIKIVEEFIRWLKNDFEYNSGNEIEAIENLLSRLKTAERMNDVLASTTYDYANLEMLNICPAEYEGKVDLRKCKQFGKDINCIKCIKEWARKKVEENV